MKKILLILWVVFSLISVYFYFSNPEMFNVNSILNLIKSHKDYILPIYMILFIARSFTLIPGTPFVLAGTLLFPDKPYTVLLICIICMIISSLILYYFSELLGFDKILKNKYPKKIEQIQKKLNGKYGVIFITLWAFLPFAPTDLVCYTAGILKINIFIYLTGIIIGELIICWLYIFGYRFI